MKLKLSGVNNPVVRWWIAFSLQFITIITALTTGGLGSFIYDTDRTYLSWVILTLFVGASMHLGLQVRQVLKIRTGTLRSDFGATDRMVEMCTSLGLLGTIIGLLLTITGAFTDINASNHESIKAALVAISSGVGTALTTTMIGIVCALCLQVQLAVTREKWRA